MTPIVKFCFQSNQFFLSLSFCLLLSIFFSCSSEKKVLQKADDSPTLITYSKERTRGQRKPLYSIELLAINAVKYKGIANVPIIGERIIPISKKEHHQILQQFKAANFTTFDQVYKGKMRDLPLSSITFQQHKITYQESVCPAPIEKLARLMEGFMPTK